ncbi:MAG: hypothetical protein WC476_01045 [Phycisphaerae bacterium]|jgi:hypothetical protein
MSNLGDAPSNAILGIAYGGTNNADAPTSNKFLVYDGTKYAASAYDQASFSASGHGHAAADISDFDTEVGNQTDVAANTSARHSQNTDSGTTAQTFVIDSDAGAPISLKNNSGVLEIRNGVDNAYMDLKVKDLQVTGTTTTINSEVLTIDDNVIVLNNNVTGSPTENGGIEVERGTSDNAVLVWDESDDLWKAGISGSQAAISLLGHAHAWADVNKSGSSIADLTTHNYSDLDSPPGDDDFHTITAETSIASDDELLIYDTSVSAYRKMTRANLVAGIDTNPAGSDTFVQYNDGGSALGGSANFTFDDATNKLTINGPFSHSGSSLGFFAANPAVRSTGWAVTNANADKVYDANATSINELADILGTLITDLVTYGLLGA